MGDYRNNHYVPQAYQRNFIPQGAKERKFYYLDVRPEMRVSKGGRAYTRADVMRWGPPRCFYERDLYTTTIGQWFSTALERHFFGEVDRLGPSAVEYFAGFRQPSVNHQQFQTFVRYMSLQKLRTPKGLSQLGELVKTTQKNATLTRMQQLRDVFCAIWAEGVWCILDASQSPTKFILSDHPVTVYNKGCFPGSRWCRSNRDPDIRLNGTHTLMPLSIDKILVITNRSWLNNPYGSPLAMRPNPTLMRPAIFNFENIQTGRSLSETEVREINYVVKERAVRYVAAAEKDWLYPERSIPSQTWDKLGRGYLFMPDPRGMAMTGEVFMIYGDGRKEAFDAYGRRPGEQGYGGEAEQAIEWIAHLAFQGEYARVFGPKRRGRPYIGKHATYEEEDAQDAHAYYLGLEAAYKDRLRKMGVR